MGDVSWVRWNSDESSVFVNYHHAALYLLLEINDVRGLTWQNL